jgi:putative endonuclease
MPERRFTTYILECADGTLYTGWTDDIERRLQAHNSGCGAKYTRSRTPVRLLASWQFDSKQEAMRREYAIKKLPRAEKLKLAGKHVPASASSGP